MIRFLRLCRYCCWWIPRSSICWRNTATAMSLASLDVWDFLSRLVAGREKGEELCTTTRHARVSTGESHNFCWNNSPFFFYFFVFSRKGKKKKYVNITLTPIWKHCLRAKETVRRYETRSFKGSDFSLPNFFLFPVFFCKAHDFPVYSNQKVSGVYLFNCIPLRILCDCAHL